MHLKYLNLYTCLKGPFIVMGAISRVVGVTIP